MIDITQDDDTCEVFTLGRLRVKVFGIPVPMRLWFLLIEHRWRPSDWYLRRNWFSSKKAYAAADARHLMGLK